MTLQRAHWSFTQGTRAPVWGINGRYLGPTIRVWKGMTSSLSTATV